MRDRVHKIEPGDILKLKPGNHTITLDMPPDSGQGSLWRDVVISEEEAERPAIFLHESAERPEKACWVLVGTIKAEIPWSAIELVDKDDGRRHLHVEHGLYLA